MGASTANRPDLASNEVAYINYPVKASTHIYAGSHVMVIAGYAMPCADTSGGDYVGQAATEANNTGADGAITVQVVPNVLDPFKTFNAASPAIATWLNKRVFLADDNSVTLFAGSTNKVCAGTVVGIVNSGSSGSVMVDTSRRFVPAAT